MNNIKSLSNTELVNQYKIAKKNYINAEEGTPEEQEADKLYTELFQELNDRDLDLRDYKVITENKECSTMKSIKTIISTLVMVGALLISNTIQASAKDVQATVINSNDTTITAEYNNQFYTFNKASDDDSNWNKGDSITIDLEIAKDYKVEIQSIDKINNSITIQKGNDLYSFYVDDIDNYYLSESIVVTMNDDKKEVLDCKVLDQPVIYNTQIDSIKDDIATLSANGSKYTFDNLEGQDGWEIGDKCKVVIQDGKLLEVRPIPLDER